MVDNYLNPLIYNSYRCGEGGENFGNNFWEDYLVIGFSFGYIDIAEITKE